MTNAVRWILGVIVSIFTLLYLLPFSVGLIRRKENIVSIFVVNLFLGWTLVGWVIALAWAFAVDKKSTIVN